MVSGRLWPRPADEKNGGTGTVAVLLASNTKLTAESAIGSDSRSSG